MAEFDDSSMATPCEHEQGTFKAAGDLELYYQAWRPSAQPAGVLVLLHGLSEHSGRYMPLVNTLLSMGVSVYTFDHRGHGRSTDERLAHVEHWDEYLEDVHAFMGMVTEGVPGLPVFLMGHSMGGLIAANYALHYPEGLSGVILSAPPLGDLNISPWLVRLGRVAAVVRPRTVFRSGLELGGISRDQEVLRNYRDDPLIHGQVTARWGVEFLKARDWTRDHAEQFSVPLLIFHGDADSLVPIEGSQAFYARVKHPDKAFIFYEGGYHESLGDSHREQVLHDISHWLRDRLA